MDKIMSSKYTILGYDQYRRDYIPVLILNNASAEQAEKLAFDLTYIKCSKEMRYITVGNVKIDLDCYTGFKYTETPYLYDGDFTIRPMKEYTVLLQFVEKDDDCDGVFVNFICHENEYYINLSKAKKEREQEYGKALKFGRLI